MELTGQWADSLLGFERLFYLKLLVWGGVSAIVGSILHAVIRIRGEAAASPLLRSFATTNLVLGFLLALVALRLWQSSALRDHSGAVALDRATWFGVGLGAGLVLTGLALAACGWKLGRRDGVVGAGVAVQLHGIALVLLLVQLSADIVR